MYLTHNSRKSSASYFKPGTQIRACYEAHDRIADANEVMLDLLFGPNPITDDELRKLIVKRPHIYGRFAGYLGTR